MVHRSLGQVPGGQSRSPESWGRSRSTSSGHDYCPGSSACRANIAYVSCASSDSRRGFSWNLYTLHCPDLPAQPNRLAYPLASPLNFRDG